MTGESTLPWSPLLMAATESPAGSAEASMRRLAEGDRAAAAELYDRFGDELYGLALWLCRSVPDASEVVQEVFLRLLLGRGRLRRVRDARAYLLRMTRTAAVDLLRRRRRGHQTLDEGLLAPATPDPVAAIEAARLSRLLVRLPAKQRVALYLRFFSGLSFAEIGRVTGVPTFTAASRCRLALARLRRWREKGGRA